MSPVPFVVAGDGDFSHAATLYTANTAAHRRTVLVLAHGAGAGQSSPWMVRYARALAERGVDVVTFDFPYMQRGKRGAPDRAPVLEDTFRRVVGGAVAHPQVQAARVLIGGKSMGGRIATHLAAAPNMWPALVPPLSGVLAFGYPLQPPGGTSSVSPDRVSHLGHMTAPALIIQGTRDTFGGPDALRAALDGRARERTITIHDIEGGDHSLAVRKSAGRAQSEVDTAIWDAVIAWDNQQLP